MLALGVVSHRATVASLDSGRQVRHTYEVLNSLQDLLQTMRLMDSATRGYVITGQDSYLEPYRNGLAMMQQREEAFRTLTADNPVQQNRAPGIEALATQEIQRLRLVVGLRQSQGLDAAVDSIRNGPGAVIMKEFEGLVGAAREEELRLLALRRMASDQKASWTSTMLMLGTLLGTLMAVVAGWSVHRDVIRRRLAEASLREEEERFHTMANNISQLAWMADEKGSIFWFNERWFEFTGFSAEDMAGPDWRQHVHHPDHMQRVIDKLRLCFQTGAEWEDTFPLRGRDGYFRWFLSRAVPIRDSHGKVLRWFGTSTDITENKLLEEALFEERERAQVTLKSIGDAVACTNVTGKISFINVVAERMTGWSSQEATGQPMGEVLQIVNATTRDIIPNPMERAATLDRVAALPSDCVLIRRDGFETPIEDSVAPIHDREGMVTGAVIVFRDVSKSRAMALQMAHSARHDFLTGLPNRMLLNDRIGQAIAIAPRHDKKVAVLFLDLDGFKHINDTLGHAVGDRLLQSIAARLQSCVRVSDTVGRIGGDEFVALLSEVDRSEDAALCATRMLQAVAAVHAIDHHRLFVTTSIGISVCPDNGADAGTLIRNADVAMYQTKQAGRQAFRFFAPQESAASMMQPELNHACR